MVFGPCYLLVQKGSGALASSEHTSGDKWVRAKHCGPFASGIICRARCSAAVSERPLVLLCFLAHIKTHGPSKRPGSELRKYSSILAHPSMHESPQHTVVSQACRLQQITVYGATTGNRLQKCTVHQVSQRACDFLTRLQPMRIL